MSYIRYKNNKLFIENVSVNQLASKLKTPFYLYSEGNIVENYNSFSNSFKKSNEIDFEISLRANLSEYIGHEQIITFDYANQEILAKFPSTIKIELAKETKLFFDITQISLFDAKTDERI